MEFPGAVVLVTHDRFLLERVSTTLLGIHGGGTTTMCTDLAQWSRARAEMFARRNSSSDQREAKKAKADEPPRERSAAKKALSYAEKKELASMEERISAVEETIAAVKAELELPAVMADHARLADACRRLEAAQASADALYARWQELEEKSA
jgi:ATP-binding cassette subfamily F protein uup